MTAIRLTAIALLALLVSSCASPGSLSTAGTGEDTSILPQLLGLEHTASSYLEVPGVGYTYQQGGMEEDTSLVLVYDPEVTPPQPAEPVLPAFAVYLLSSGEDPVAALEVRVDAGNQAAYWLALYDWQRRTWDYSPGSFPDTAQISPDSYAPGNEHYISPAGSMAVAVILYDATAPLTIRYLKLTTIAEVTELSATTDRWDGIMLNWTAHDDARLFQVYRRPAGAPEDAWQLLTPEPLDMHAHLYLDQNVDGGVPVDYRISVGIQPPIYGMPTWYWSPGALVQGQHWPDSLGQQLGDADPVTAYCPANMYNRLSFFYLPATAPRTVEGISNAAYPPEGTWTAYSADEVGGGQLELSVDEDWPPPFALHTSSTHNSQALTLAYSTGTGTYAQVVATAPDGGTAWDEPLLVRPAGQHLLGLLPMLKRVGLVTWNHDLERIELRDSIDMYGRLWWEFDPGNNPRQVIGSRRPAGEVELRLLGSSERVTFIEDGTGEVVSYVLKGEWIDDSPGLTAAAGPTVRMALTGSSLPGIALVYLTPDYRRIKLVRRTGGGVWLIYEKEDLVIAKGGATISEFKLLTSGDVSWASYVAYVLDGNLYMRHTGYAQLLNWGNPVLIDDAGDIHGIDVIKVGTGDDWSTINFVTYLSADESGVERINYRNLDALR